MAEKLKLSKKVKLTKPIIEAATPAPLHPKTGKADEYVLWDTEIAGLGLRVRTGGSKVFFLVYRVDGKQRKLTLRPFGVITIEEARREARIALGDVARGEDPGEEKQAARVPQPEPAPAPTLKVLKERYLKQYAERNHKPKTLREDRRLLEVIQSKLGEDLEVASIGRAHATILKEDLGDHPAQANAALRRLSAILGYAESIGWRPEGSNPCRRVEHYREKPRKRFLSAGELARLGKVLEAEEARRIRKDKEHPARWSRSAALLVRLLLTTGLRPGEVLSLKWEYLRPELEILLLPDTKGGERTIPLSRPALELLEDAIHITGNPWILPGVRKNAHLVNPDKPWHEIRKAAGLEDVHLHDLRHTFASWAASGGISLYMIAEMLGHKQAATSQRYAHLAQDPVKQAADQTAGDIAAALEGKEPAQVVDLRR